MVSRGLLGVVTKGALHNPRCVTAPDKVVVDLNRTEIRAAGIDTHYEPQRHGTARYVGFEASTAR